MNMNTLYTTPQTTTDTDSAHSSKQTYM